MNGILKAAGVVLALCVGTASAADVGVSISIGDPGYYGRLDIGVAPRPALVYAQPVVVGRPVVYSGAPLYLRVPPGHRSRWESHCGYYGACGMPVYFVQDGWYDTVYVPAYRERHGHWHEVRHDHHHRHHDRRHDHDRGHGRGNGRGHGRGDGRHDDRRGHHDRDDRHRRH